MSSIPETTKAAMDAVLRLAQNTPLPADTMGWQSEELGPAVPVACLTEDQFVPQEPILTVTGEKATLKTATEDYKTCLDAQQMFLTGEIIKVNFGHYVEKDGKAVFVADVPVQVHKEPLVRYSKYFKGMFNSHMIENATSTVNLAGDVVRPRPFILLYNLAQTGGYSVKLRGAGEIDSLMEMYDAYLAAQYLGMDELGTWVVKMMHGVIGHLTMGWYSDYAAAVAQQGRLMVTQQERVQDLLDVIDRTLGDEHDRRPLQPAEYNDLLLRRCPAGLLQANLEYASPRVCRLMAEAFLSLRMGS